MYAHVCSQGDATNKEQKSVERVEYKHGDRNSEAFHDGGANQVEERQHGENGDEHDIVDDRRVAGDGIGDDIADQRHDQEGHQELVMLGQYARGTRTIADNGW